MRLMGNGKNMAGERLQLLMDRIERLEEEKKGIADDIRDVYAEGKAVGFCPKTMKTVRKLIKMTPDDRMESLSMVEVYMQALGLSDVGLSEMAAKFLSERGNGGGDVETDVDQDVPEFIAPAVPNKNGDQGEGEEQAAPLTVDDATKMGGEAQVAGKPVTSNPFPPRDPRRAAWDTAWCLASGTDGMDIPSHLMSNKAIEDKAKADAKRQQEDEQKAADAKAATAAAAVDEETMSEQLEGEPLERARHLVVKNQKGSASWLQREMGIGYAAAAMLLDKLQRDGVVSAPNLQGRRDVLEQPEGEDDA